MAIRMPRQVPLNHLKNLTTWHTASHDAELHVAVRLVPPKKILGTQSSC